MESNQAAAGRSNRQWLEELRRSPPGCNQAIEELNRNILRGLRISFSARPGVDTSLLEDVTQDAVLRVLERLDSFRGESRFLTWSNKVAVRIALTELRRRRWRDVSLESFEHPEDMFESMMEVPEEAAVRKECMAILKKTIQEDLTGKQRTALVAVMFKGMPLEETARRLGTNRNSLYKLMHDARLRLKSALLERGLSSEEILDAFR